MEIFPATTVTDVVASITATLADNIAVIVGMLGFSLGVALVLRLFRKSTKGRV